MNEDNQYFK